MWRGACLLVGEFRGMLVFAGNVEVRVDFNLELSKSNMKWTNEE